MSFEIVKPGEWSQAEVLGAMECSIDRKATMLARSDDLKIVGIGDRVVVLVDPETNRLALRAPRADEDQVAIASSIATKRRGKSDSSRRRIGLSRALKQLGRTGQNSAGRFEFVTKDKGPGGLLFITLPHPKSAKNDGPT